MGLLASGLDQGPGGARGDAALHPVALHAMGLYDEDGVLRFAGRDREDCLSYAELFELTPETYSLASLGAASAAVEPLQAA